MIALALGRAVEQHDDNSGPGMYDLRVGPEANPDIAIEVTGAVDRTFAETWNSGPAKGPKQWALVGDWAVQLKIRPDLNAIDAQLPFVLQLLESQNFEGGPVDHVLRRHDRAMWELLDGLGISYLTCCRRSGSGEVSFTMAGEGGAIDSSGASLPTWVSDWLREPEQADVLKKLTATTAPERHVFVPVDLHGAGWPVESYLLTWLGERQLPSDPPDLPEPITAVWLASTMADRGVRWDGQRWSWFAARSPELDD